MELLLLYKWTILAGALTAPALALLGCQLATRDRAMQTLCVGQGATVGVLVGIGVFYALDEATLGPLGPFLTGLVVSAATYTVTDRLVARKVASKNTTFAFIFALLLALGQLASSLFPALENHLAQIYFGDLATLTVTDSQVAAIASALCLLVLVRKSRVISNQSFDWAVFGSGIPQARQLGFQVLSLVMLCLSVQFVGFLFTIALLFLPTALMNYLSTKGLRLHFVLCSVLATAATLVGFLLSLRFTRLPTVPTIVAVLFLLSVVVLGVEWVWLRVTRAAWLADNAMHPEASGAPS